MSLIEEAQQKILKSGQETAAKVQAKVQASKTPPGPPGSFITTRDGYTVDAATARRLNAEDPELYRVLINQGYRAYLGAIQRRQQVTESQVKAQQREVEKLRSSDPYLYQIYQEKGYDAFKAAVEKRTKDIEAINLRSLRKTDKYLASVYIEAGGGEKGWEAVARAVEKRKTDIEAINQRAKVRYEAKLKDFQKELKETNPEAYRAYRAGGMAGYAVMTVQQQAKYNRNIKAVSNYIDKDGNIDIAGYLMTNTNKKPLYELGISRTDIEAAEKYNAYQMTSGEYVAKYFKDKGWGSSEIPWADPHKEVSQADINKYESRLNEALNDQYKKAPEKKPTHILKEFAISMVPIYGTYHYYELAKQDGLTAGEKGMLAASAAADLFVIIPVIGQISAGARFARGVSVSARLAGAGKAAVKVGIAEVKAPFTVLAHPIQTAKVAYSPIETLIRRAKVPLSGIETKYNTVRLKIALTGGEKEALKLRDVVTGAMIKGKPGTVRIGDTSVKLTPAAINRLGKPVAIHTTQDIRPFLDGAKLSDDLYISPTHHSRFTYMDSRGLATPDGIHGGLIIKDDRLIKLMQSTGKTYRGTAEIEKIIPRGINLGKPIQTIISRNAAGDKLAFLVFGEKFTNAELAKMKLIGSIDTIRQIYTPAIKVKSANAYKVYDDFSELLEKKRVLTAKIRRYKKVQNTKQVARYEKELENVNSEISRMLPRLEKAYRSMAAPARIVWANFRDGVLNKWDRATVESKRGKIGQLEARVLPELDLYRPSLTGIKRAVPDVKKTRVPPKPPEQRVPPGPTKQRVPPKPPTTRIPPKPPEQRVPPEPPTTRIPPEPPTTRIPPKPPVIATIGKGVEKAEWTQADIESAIAWKQGIGYWAVRSPYGNNDWKFFKEPPEGMTISPDQKTAFETIQTTRGKAPDKLTLDMGIMDVKIQGRGGKRPVIGFKRDIRQRTHSQIRLGKVKSRKIGRYYYTNGKGGTNVSRRPLKKARVS